MNVRPAAVSGRFYPADPDELGNAVDRYLRGGVRARRPDVPRAIIGPHAGYMYCGPVAGSAFGMLAPLGATLRQAIVIGPSHHMAFDGVAASSADRFRTPLGEVAVNRDAVATALELGFVRQLDAAHEHEHSLETHLPFLQRINPEVQIVPLVTGRASATDLADLLSSIWDRQTVLCVSSDLSHFEDHASATRHDAATSARIAELDRSIGPRDACGAVAIAGLLDLADRESFECEVVDVRNSGDTAGGRDRVVGYGAYGFWAAA